MSEPHLIEPEELASDAPDWTGRRGSDVWAVLTAARDGDVERGFLRRYYKRMPRTMLRYAIEKFPENERKAWLHGEV